MTRARHREAMRLAHLVAGRLLRDDRLVTTAVAKLRLKWGTGLATVDIWKRVKMIAEREIRLSRTEASR